MDWLGWFKNQSARLKKILSTILLDHDFRPLRNQSLRASLLFSVGRTSLRRPAHLFLAWNSHNLDAILFLVHNAAHLHTATLRFTFESALWLFCR